MPSEADIQRTIIDALVWDGWMILRINQGARHEDETGRYIRFAYWQHLSIDQQDSGISDILAVKKSNNPIFDDCWVGRLLAIECKAPGKKANVSHTQAHFLAAIEKHGGIAIVADDLSDVLPYLDRVEEQ